MAASGEDKRATDQATAARKMALKDAEAVKERCRSMEAEVETMRNERAAEARSRKADEVKMKAREDAVTGRDAELEQLARVQTRSPPSSPGWAVAPGGGQRSPRMVLASSSPWIV